MYRQDGIDGRIGCDGPPDDSRGDQPISAERRSQYVTIYRKIGCDTAAYYYPDSEKAVFVLWTVGMINVGQSKSIVFLPRGEPQPLVTTTDNYHWTKRDHEESHVEIYRHIDGPWYLEYDSD